METQEKIWIVISEDPGSYSVAAEGPFASEEEAEAYADMDAERNDLDRDENYVVTTLDPPTA